LSAYGNELNSLPPFLFKDTTQSNNNLFSIDKKIIKQFYPELYGELTFQQKADMAYEVQKALEKTFLYHAEFISKNSKIKNLVIGGGCALNILGISAIKEKYPEFNIFVDPIAHDGTHSIGAGLQQYKNMVAKGNLKKANHFNSIYTGPKYDLEMMNSCIDNFLRDN
jgi:predicted NodU family carbamoyl transferase